MKKPIKMHFTPRDGSAPLGIYWYEGPYGAGVEAPEENGSLFLAPNKELLGVIFDDVDADGDSQHITTPLGDRIEITTRKGKVDVKVRKQERSA